MQYKVPLNPSTDIAKHEQLLHESIPITGSLISGTYGAAGALGSEPNVKTYTHGMFQSVYDYPYLSSSANHIFDITAGYYSSFSQTDNVAQADKHAIYNELALLHVPLSESGEIAPFDQRGGLERGSSKMKQCVFINLAKLLTKDEIKKGTFKLELGVSGSGAGGGRTDHNAYKEAFTTRVEINDAQAAGTNGAFKTNSPAGEFGLLKMFNSNYESGSGYSVTDGNNAGPIKNLATVGTTVGHIYYQTGLVVLTASVFTDSLLSSSVPMDVPSLGTSTYTKYIDELLTGSSIDATANAVRHRIYNMQFDNTTKLYSTVYFCRANHKQFNYSTNPTYVSGGQIVNKVNAKDMPYAYITTVGLYSSDNELMAVGKFSEPVYKDPTTELVIKARLDY